MPQSHTIPLATKLSLWWEYPCGGLDGFGNSLAETLRDGRRPAGGDRI
ncbi:MAG: hypothetical protein KME08_16590 [Aphanothece sp. CMT-3BRIN-NPC111]|nr:hypothetical protein [Aphanothece sp. CMT-3BRIN-NPC111]